MPLSGRPLRMISPISLLFTSCATSGERTRSGPRAPVASAPWQKPQDSANCWRPPWTAGSFATESCAADCESAAEFQGPKKKENVSSKARNFAGFRFSGCAHVGMVLPRPDILHALLSYRLWTHWKSDRGKLVDGGWARSNAEDVGNRPCNGIRVILLERGFIAAAEFHFNGSNVYVKLRFRPAFQ